MTPTRRCILGVFAHPDDETSCAGGTFSRYAHAGVEVYVATATRGEQGKLGTHGQEVTREDLPRVREAELRTVLQMYGARPPIFLGYRDREVSHANADELTAKIAAVMAAPPPDVVITFGLMGLSGHPDHVAVHRATVVAFHRYRHLCRCRGADPRIALPHLWLGTLPTAGCRWGCRCGARVLRRGSVALAAYLWSGRSVVRLAW